MTELIVARDQDDDRVVIRFIRDKYARDRKIRKSFLHGVEVLTELDHPNIVAVYDYGKHKGHLYVVVEYHENLNLRERIVKRDPSLAVHQLPLLTQFAEALSFVHAAGYLHMDLKPENLLICEDMSLILVDFDLVLSHKGKPIRLKQVSGTPTYLAPETLRERTVDTRSEIYSFGICAYEMLSFQRPYLADNPNMYQRVVSDLSTEAIPLSHHRPDIPKQINDLVMKCLAKRPEARYPSMRLVHHELANM